MLQNNYCIYSPLPLGMVVIILGRGRLTSQGLIVYLGIIDGDCNEKIKIMVYVKKKDAI